MTVTNGYSTLARLKDRILQARSYTAATISFASGTKAISDSAYGLRRFQTGDYIKLSGSTSNDGYYTVATGNTPDSIVVSESLTTEAAGDTVTITEWSDLDDDATLESAIEAVSRLIDKETRTRFYTSTSDETRYFTAYSSSYCPIPFGLLSVTTLATDDDLDRTYSTTWTTSDYELWPLDATVDTRPYLAIYTKPDGSEGFSANQRDAVKVVGKFGYCTAANQPEPIEEACLLQAARLFKRKDAPFGVAGAGALGQSILIAALDPDVKRLLAPYTRLGIG